MWKVFSVFTSYFRAMMRKLNDNNTVVVVLGATGTGKSKLALEIASKFNGEIINADSMQIYKGLDIVTNKVSQEERLVVPHHMLDFLDPMKFYNVAAFRNATLPIIDRIHKDGRVPVIVGGTHYYVESLLWNVLVPTQSVSEMSDYNDLENRIKFIKEKISEINEKKLNLGESNLESVCDEVLAHSVKCDEVLTHSVKKFECIQNDKIVSQSVSAGSGEIFGQSVNTDSGEIFNQSVNTGSGEIFCQSVNTDSGEIFNQSVNTGSGEIFDQSLNTDSGEIFDRINDVSSSDNSVKNKMCEYKNLLSFINSECISNEDLLSLLGTVDSEMAASYHPNNRRKVERSLEVWVETGMRHSEHIRRQSAEVGGADLGGRIRFQNVAILWVTCDKSVLDKRVEDRVDLMIEQGLLQELSEFHATYYRRLVSNTQDEGCETAAFKVLAKDRFRKGIFQCIGFKEFEDYLMLEEEHRATDEGKVLYEAGIDLMKLRTRQYSRSQLKWIRNRFFRRTRMKLPVYAVDGTDPSLWKEKVSSVAEEVVDSIMRGKVPSVSPVTLKDEKSLTGDKTRYVCEVCDRVFIGDHQWADHLRGAKHLKLLKRKRTTEENKEDKKCPKVSL